jgi:DNA modification methylase
MVINMECRAFMSSLPSNTFDSIVTDPPYGLSKQPNMREVLKHWLNGDDYTATGGGFMGKSWDSFVPGPKTWEQALRVLKPGGYAVVFAGSRTVDLMATSLRLAGFEVVDMLHWMYGSGFPKSLDIGKAVDARDGLGAKREVQLKVTEWIRSTGLTSGAINMITNTFMGSHYTTAASQPSVPTRTDFEKLRTHFGKPVPQWVEDAVDERTTESENLKRREVIGHHTDPAQAAKWRGKYDGGNVNEAAAITTAYSDEAKQWEGWGTALKPCHEPIILCRKPLEGTYANNVMTHGCGALNIDGCRVGDEEMQRTKSNGIKISENGSMAGGNYGRVAAEPSQGRWPGNVLHDGCLPEPMDRYFYHAKASKADRDEGMDGFAHKSAGECTGGRGEDSDGLNSPRAGAGRTSGARNIHPTVKPTAVMQWLCRLVTPPGGTLLDPFCGSGSTLKAAALEGFNAVGCEMSPEYAEIARAREEAAKCRQST